MEITNESQLSDGLRQFISASCVEFNKNIRLDEGMGMFPQLIEMNKGECRINLFANLEVSGTSLQIRYGLNFASRETQRGQWQNTKMSEEGVSKVVTSLRLPTKVELPDEVVLISPPSWWRYEEDCDHSCFMFRQEAITAIAEWKKELGL